MARATGGEVVVQLLQEVAEMRQDMADLRQDVSALARSLVATTKRMDSHLGRMARLVTTMADDTRLRFERVEERLDALETRRS